MRSQVLVKRYAQGFLGSCRKDEEFKILYQELSDFVGLLTSQKKLSTVLTTPFLPSSKKKKITEEILSKTSLQQKNSRFILLLVEKDRLEILPEIIEIIPDLWNEEKGISTFEVFSVVPLSDAQKKKLSEKLEHIEKGPIALKYRIDSSLIGGISLRKGNIVYDVSVKGHLAKLQEKICEG